jgi:hypothetical protein
MVSENQVKVIDQQEAIESHLSGDDFMLNASQMEFMFRIHNQAERAYQTQDLQFFRDLVLTDNWQQLFLDMGWDQAWDCYEVMIGECDDCESALNDVYVVASLHRTIS